MPTRSLVVHDLSKLTVYSDPPALERCWTPVKTDILLAQNLETIFLIGIQVEYYVISVTLDISLHHQQCNVIEGRPNRSKNNMFAVGRQKDWRVLSDTQPYLGDEIMMALNSISSYLTLHLFLWHLW